MQELFWLFILALPVACISWTVTKEELLREPREWLEERSEKARWWWQRKLAYMFTCEYCFSHYVAAGFVALTEFRLLLDDWRGVVIAWLALVAIANVYMSIYARVRVEIRKERAEADNEQAKNGTKKAKAA